MTGSGSAVFAEIGADDASEQAPSEWHESDHALPAGWVYRMCRGLERHPLADWSDH